MLKKMLQKLAAKSLTIALVMTVMAVPATNMFTPASAYEGPTIYVGANIPTTVEYYADENDSSFAQISEANDNCNTEIEPGYIVCSYDDTTPGGYIFVADEQTGYELLDPLKQLEVNGVDDLVLFDYIKDEIPPIGIDPLINFDVHTELKDENNVIVPATEEYTRNNQETLDTPDSFIEKLSVLENDNSYGFDFADKPGYTSPGTLVIQNGVINNIPANVTVEEDGVNFNGGAIDHNSDYEITGTYTQIAEPDPEELTLIISAEDENGNPLDGNPLPNAQFERNALTTHTTPRTTDEELKNLDNESIEYLDLNGYTKPNGTLVITNQTIQSVPNGIRVEEGGDAYTLGSTFKDGSTLEIIGTYVKNADQYKGDLFKIEKDVISETTLGDNNKEATYQIKITRDINGPTGTFTLNLDDTINNNNRTLTGDNGGTLKVQSNNNYNYTYSHCKDACNGDLTAAPITVTTTAPGQIVTIAYDVKSNNSNIDDGESSDFDNIAVGTYTHPTLGNVTISADEELTVNGEPNKGDIDFDITKQIIDTDVIDNDGNVRVDYRITVQRTNSGTDNDVKITVEDTISDNGKIYGDNGGVMEVVGNGSCSNGCGDITDGPVNIYLGPNEKVTLEYTLESDISGIDDDEESDFENIALGKYEDENGNDQETKDDEEITLDGEPGDDETKITVLKEVVDTDSIDNDGNVEIDYRITVRRDYNGSNSDIEVTVSDTVGDNNGVLYGDNGGRLEVVGNGSCSLNSCDDITDGDVELDMGRGDVVYFYYTMRSNNNSIPDNESSDFENVALARYEDSDGDDKDDEHEVTVTIDGEDDAVDNGLDIDLTATQNTAYEGDCLIYTVTATNNTGRDLTGVILHFDYDNLDLDINNSYTGDDNGSAVTWNHGDLDEGDQVSYQVSACVTNHADPGDVINSVARGLANELTNTPSDDHDLRIIGANVLPLPPTTPKSGAGMTVALALLATALGYVFYNRTGQRRYQKLKAKALKF